MISKPIVVSGDILNPPRDPVRTQASKEPNQDQEQDLITQPPEYKLSATSLNTNDQRELTQHSVNSDEGSVVTTMSHFLERYSPNKIEAKEELVLFKELSSLPEAAAADTIESHMLTQEPLKVGPTSPVISSSTSQFPNWTITAVRSESATGSPLADEAMDMSLSTNYGLYSVMSKVRGKCASSSSAAAMMENPAISFMSSVISASPEWPPPNQFAGEQQLQQQQMLLESLTQSDHVGKEEDVTETPEFNLGSLSPRETLMDTMIDAGISDLNLKERLPQRSPFLLPSDPEDTSVLEPICNLDGMSMVYESLEASSSYATQAQPSEWIGSDDWQED